MTQINNNIQEDYCSFEVSKLLKEKGAKLTNFGVLVGDGEKDYITCSHSRAIKWIRENFRISIEPYVNEHGKWLCNVVVDWTKTHIGSGNFSYFDKSIKIHNDWKGFLKPEQATDAALLYTLQNLIP